jgi:hypothetical protein
VIIENTGILSITVMFNEFNIIIKITDITLIFFSKEPVAILVMFIIIWAIIYISEMLGELIRINTKMGRI